MVPINFGNSLVMVIATFNYGRGGFIHWKPGFVCAAMSDRLPDKRLAIALRRHYSTAQRFACTAFSAIPELQHGKKYSNKYPAKPLFSKAISQVV